MRVRFERYFSHHWAIISHLSHFYPIVSHWSLFLHFFDYFFLLLLILLQLWEFVEKMSKNEDFLLFTIIYPKINLNLVKTVYPRQYFANAHDRKFKFPLAKLSQIGECKGKFQRLHDKSKYLWQMKSYLNFHPLSYFRSSLKLLFELKSIVSKKI